MQPAPWNPYQDKAQQASRQSRHTPQTPLSPGQQHNPYVQASASQRDSPLTMHPTRGDRDGDIAMEDADPYKPKHASLLPTISARGSHQRMSSNVNEESSAARRYSPMNLTPASPPGAQQQPTSGNFVSYTSQGSSARASPTRQSFVPSSPAYYNSPPSK
jgi:dual specificity protein kinase YAK1